MRLLGSWWLRFAVFAVLCALLLVPRMPVGNAVAWSLACAFGVATGIGMLRLSGREHADMKRIQRSSWNDAPRDGERVAFCGIIEADDEPIESPVRKRPCVLYHFAVLHRERWSVSVGGGTKEVTDFAGYGATPCRVIGTSGSVRLHGFPTLHGFEERSISSVSARENVREFLRGLRFEERKRGEVEWIYFGEDLWDGRTKTERNFRAPGASLHERAIFSEASVGESDRVCVVGKWSESEKAVVAANDQELWLYRGEPETVRETLSSSVGCGRFVGIALMLAGAGTALYVGGWF
jgi:hypothetical protein